ncbi:hypothetical protein [Marinactinospora rubrisoli]|uniref:Uncharacterized protein n=1 Tax=Marinactinospora rubrisoli TaxID=2715399 RepID=A0ABW2KEW3_9ACTN
MNPTAPVIWFGRHTGHWWALHGDRLYESPTREGLAALLAVPSAPARPAPSPRLRAMAPVTSVAPAPVPPPRHRRSPARYAWPSRYVRGDLLR